MAGNSFVSTIIIFAMAASVPVASMGIGHRPSHSVLQPQLTDRPSIVEVEDPSSQYPISNDGYYYATAFADSHSVKMLVDSGANITVLSASDARNAGIRLTPRAYRERLQTANGTARIAVVILRHFTVAHKTFDNIKVAVADNDKTPTLLGSDVLSRFGRVTIADEVLQLTA